MVICGKEIKPGTSRQVDMFISRLPSRTPIEVPVYVSRANKKGPTLLLMAGMHGDEINGPEIIRRLLVNGHIHPIRGNIICIPVLNIFGFIYFNRQVPDGKDVNRSFPGSESGSLASRIAYHLMNDILPHVDIGIDFHTGGANRANYPQIRCVFGDPTNMEIADAFHPPFIVNSSYIKKSFRHAASQKGKHIIVFEGGESLRFDEQAITRGVNGAIRVMQHLEMCVNAPEPTGRTLKLSRTTWLRANGSGLFHPEVKPGERIKARQAVGKLTDAFGEYEEEVISPQSGYVLGLNYNPVVMRGDALIHLGMGSK